MKNQKGFPHKISNQPLSAFLEQFPPLIPNKGFKKGQTVP